MLFGGTVFVTASLSRLQKTELLLLAETLDADAAHRYQLVTKVLPVNGFDAQVQRQLTAVSALSSQVR